MKNSVHDNGGFIGRVADYTAEDYYTTLEPTNYAVENGVYTNVSMATGFASSTNVVFSTDGTKVYFHESGTRYGNYATLSTPSDLSTASSLTSYSVRNGTSTQGLTFNPTGTMLYYVNNSGNIYISPLSTAWDISTRHSETIISLGIGNPVDFQFNNDGTKAYTMRSGNIYFWPLSTAYDFTTRGSIVSKYLVIGGQEGFRFNSDGTKLFTLHGQTSPGARIVEYSLSTAYDTTSVGAGTTHSDIGTQVSDPRGFTFSHDGTNFYVVGENNTNVYEYSFTSNLTVNQNKKNTGVWSMDADYLNAELDILIPTTGLIAHLDPANYTSGTTFADVSGNNNDMTLAGSPTHNTTNGGTFSFTTSQSMTTPNSGDMDRETLDYTVIYAAKTTDSNGARVLQSVGNNWLLGFWYGFFNSYYASGWVNRNSYKDTNWRIFSATRNHSADQDVFYSNGVSVVSNTSGSNGFRGLSVNNGAYAENSNCEVGILLVYDRVLTATEITQVYDIYKSRYGLT